MTELNRLTARHQFVRLAQQGQRWVTPAFVVQAQIQPEDTLSSSQSRYGLTASRKVGGAVKRNRARRRLRALAEQHLPALSHAQTDYVLIARSPEIFDRPFTDLTKDLSWALKHVHRQLQEAQHAPQHESAAQSG